jgi:endonuclease YncB( thermonuclease family)
MEETQRMYAGQTARVQWKGVDSYNRLLGRVHCRGVDADAEQVKRGMAWGVRRIRD